MTELELYKFVQGKEISWRGERLLLWIPFFHLEEFTKLLGYNYLSEGGEQVWLLTDCVAVELNDICDNFEIEATNILAKDK